jgi:methyltransferase (TIGR00027 family)
MAREAKNPQSDAIKPGIQTAVYAAANRAVESEKPAGERICYDPLAKKFIGLFAYWRFKGMQILRQGRGYTLQTYVLYRCRHIDEYLHVRLESGVTQVAILGAGWDSRAYRGDLMDRGIRTFEVDHPATQAEKIRRVRRLFRTVPPHIVYVPLDFLGGSLDALLAHGFDPSSRTLFVCEGLTYYLNAAAVDVMLEWIHSHAAERSAVILDYKFPPETPRNTRRASRRTTGFAPKRSGEWITYGMRKDQVEGLLAGKGFVRIRNVPAEDLPNLYGAESNRGRWGLRQFAIASAKTGKP